MTAQVGRVLLGGQRGSAVRHAPVPGAARLRHRRGRALLFASGPELGEEDVRRAIANGRRGAVGQGGVGAAGDESLEAAERRHIRATLSRLSGDVRAAAKVLGISRSGLYKKLQRHDLSPSG